MSKQDCIQRFIFENQAIRGEIVHLADSYRTIISQHNYPPIIQKLLGETLVAAVLLTAIVKFKGVLTIQFQGDGAVKMLVAKCDNAFNIRGVAKFDENANSAQLAAGFGNGKLVITIAPDNLSKPYQSIVSINGLSINQCLENYFAQSEQLPTKIYLDVHADQAAGILLQLLPTENSQQREQFMLHAVGLSTAFVTPELLALENATILQQLYPHEDVRLFNPETVTFKCTCNIEKMQAAVKILGQEEVENIFLTSKTLEVCCEYCNHKYAFDKTEVANIFR